MTKVAKLTGAEVRIVRRALKKAIEAREIERDSYTVKIKGDPQYGRMLSGPGYDEDITDDVNRDLRDFRNLLKHLGERS